ncbi:hypothetical protein WJX77_001644 [Trebouxia sp. C0004]
MNIQVDPASLSAAEERTVKELFRMNTSGGLVSMPEVCEVLASLGISRHEHKDFKLLCNSQNTQGNLLSVDSALQALMGRSNSAYTQTKLMHAFTLFADPDGTHGFISHEVLKSALVKYSRDKLSSSDVDTQLANLTSTLQGSVDYQAIISRFYSH